MKTKLKRKQGQAMVEYIIIVAVVAIAALVIFGIFGDTIQQKIAGAASELGNEDAADATRDSVDALRSMDEEGLQ